MDLSGYKLAMIGPKNVVAKGHLYPSLMDAARDAARVNENRVASRRKPFGAICRFTVGGHKAETFFLDSLGQVDPPELEFEGRRVGCCELDVAVRQGDSLTRLDMYLNEFNGSPTGFECGYSGSGPTQLTYAMLRRLGYSKEQACVLRCDVRDRIVAKLPRDRNWTVTESEVRDAVLQVALPR